jgi:hypothetical protein
MRGHWVGKFKASAWSGEITVEADDLSTSFGGRAYLFADVPAMPSAIAHLEIKGPSPAEGVAEILPLHPDTLDPVPWSQIASRYDASVTFATRAQVKMRWTKSTLKMEWDSDIGNHGEATLTRSDASRKSDYVPHRMDWEQFKSYVTSLDHRRYAFRGQREPWRLRTHFHRTGRADLWRYLIEDMGALRRHLSARTRHVFNRHDNDENGAFYHLAQHHGYPTPLLDWSYSPFVAAFFAFRDIKNSDADRANEKCVRIFQFDKNRWTRELPQTWKVTPARPHFSLLEFMAIENERMIPQQALSGLTNVDDVESYIRSIEAKRAVQYLNVIDIPVRDRRKAMQELSAMGITAGSLFPGLDGACEELRERFFSF